MSSAKAADLRKFYRRHTKSNGIDADTLARLPLADPDGLTELTLAEGHAATLDRRVRACDRLTQQAARHKTRIKALMRQLLPMTRSPVSWARPTWRSWDATPTRGRCWIWGWPG